MKAKEYVKAQLPHSYVFSPGPSRFVVKHAGYEISDRMKTKRKAWVNAKQRLIRANKTYVGGKSAAVPEGDA